MSNLVISRSSTGRVVFEVHTKQDTFTNLTLPFQPTKDVRPMPMPVVRDPGSIMHISQWATKYERILESLLGYVLSRVHSIVVPLENVSIRINDTNISRGLVDHIYKTSSSTRKRYAVLK